MNLPALPLLFLFLPSGVPEGILAKLYDAKIAKAARIIYGGSVNPINVAAFVREETIDGVLVGHASVNAKEFLKIISEVIKKQ